MAFKDPKIEIHWLFDTELNGNKTQEKTETEYKFLELNARDKKYNKNGKLSKIECNKCSKYGHRASDFLENSNKRNNNRNNNKNNIEPRFNR